MRDRQVNPSPLAGAPSIAKPWVGDGFFLMQRLVPHPSLPRRMGQPDPKVGPVVLPSSPGGPGFIGCAVHSGV